MFRRELNMRELMGLVQPEAVEELREVTVTAAACHVRDLATVGTVFVCMDEFLEYNRWLTRRAFFEELNRSEIAVIVTPESIPALKCPQLVTKEPRRALGRIVAELSGHPEERLQLFGVTGTNGKTTTTRLLAHCCGALGLPCGALGTLGLWLGDEPLGEGRYTTPLAPELYASLQQLVASGAQAAALEVSSHGLALDRVEGLSFAAAILTNLERDHLDFHGTEEAYAEAKRRLFSRVAADGWCLLPAACHDLNRFRKASSGKVHTWGPAGSGADLELVDLQSGPDGAAFTVTCNREAMDFTTRLAGAFQVNNCLPVILLLRLLGYDAKAIREAVAGFAPVIGRMERFRLPSGAMALVDYAHNPDGLEKVLRGGRELATGRFHVVFGCGGDRDRGKRPLMGELANQLADVCWITSDNPRTEDPDRIIEDILKGVQPQQAVVNVLPDRAEAIREAVMAAREGDLVLVAGKGHEDYQLIGHEKIPFSDQAVLRELGGESDQPSFS
jgi:UDP-N-acetylmuramoyl-L-alanyl-D-glutamate--2,6-diaminopimelate ligase